MSQRLQIVVPDPAAARLRELADAAGEPVATLAARLLQGRLSQPPSNETLAKRAASSAAPVTGARPPWLEPYGGDPLWRRETWVAIVALQGRYPHQLEDLSDGWWNDDATTEQLSALAAWRAEIDEFGRDPREELAFHAELEHYRGTLRSRAGGVGSAWHPGPPPAGWLE